MAHRVHSLWEVLFAECKQSSPLCTICDYFTISNEFSVYCITHSTQEWCQWLNCVPCDIRTRRDNDSCHLPYHQTPSKRRKLKRACYLPLSWWWQNWITTSHSLVPWLSSTAWFNKASSPVFWIVSFLDCVTRHSWYDGTPTVWRCLRHLHP